MSLGDEVVEGSPKVEAPALSNDADCRLKRGSQVFRSRPGLPELKMPLHGYAGVVLLGP